MFSIFFYQGYYVGAFGLREYFHVSFSLYFKQIWIFYLSCVKVTDLRSKFYFFIFGLAFF